MSLKIHTDADISPVALQNLAFAMMGACVGKVTTEAEAVELLTRLALFDKLDSGSAVANNWGACITPELLSIVLRAGGARINAETESAASWRNRIIKHFMQDEHKRARTAMGLEKPKEKEAGIDNPFALNN